MSYTMQELEALWTAVNPHIGNAHTMAAIALAESSGNSSEVNSIGACGLWQIHPYETGCLNPVTNAQQAGKKLSEQGLTAWTTFTNGAYRHYLTGTTTPHDRQEAERLQHEIESGGPGSGIPSLKEGGEALQEGQKALESPFNAFKAFGQTAAKIDELLFTKSGWVRIGKVLIGVSVLLLGIFGSANVGVVESATKTGGKAKKAAETGVALAALVK